MAHLLVMENWVFGTGILLPKKIKELGHTFTFVTRNPDHYLDPSLNGSHPVLDLAEKVLVCETNDPLLIIPFLQEHHKTLKFDGILTVCDYYVDAISAVASALNLPQAFSCKISDIRRKHKVRELIDNAGIANCRYHACRNWEEVQLGAKDLGYPLVIKPSDLASSALVKLVHNENELRLAFDENDKMEVNFRNQPREKLWLLEEYMEGPEFSVEACTFNGETHILGVTDKSLTGHPYFIENGHMFPADIPSELEHEICQLVRDTLVAVGHDHGLSHTEVKVTDRGPRIVEINSRPGGNYIAELMEIVTNFDVLKAHIELALNIKPDTTKHNTNYQSAAVYFTVPEKTGQITAIQGLEQLESHPDVHRVQYQNLIGRHIEPAIDNATYLGHLITKDSKGKNARQLAEQLSATLQFEVSA